MLKWTCKWKEIKMSEVKLQTLWRVEIIESERGWGSKLGETKFFDNQNEAEEFCKTYNSENKEKIVPDWYMYSRVAGRVN
jgi:hypothetical protein